MFTAAAARFDARVVDGFAGVASRRQLAALGIDADQVARQAAARRWQAWGAAVVLHNAEPDRAQRMQIAVLNCGPRAVLTSFTAAEAWGLRDWTRSQTHVLAPAGTRRPPIVGLILHRTTHWRRADIAAGRRLHRLAPALIVAASSFPSARPACGLLAAAVQQRLLTARDLRDAVTVATRTRHRSALLAAVADIGQGAHALSEIDFIRLCRRHGLPTPTRQAVRVEPNGRRRYLDVEWRLPDGRVVAVEVDGALHLAARRWYDDQLRQNEVVIAGTIVLRYPSAVVRNEPHVVLGQLRRILSSARR